MATITTHCAYCDASVNATVLHGRFSGAANQPKHTSWTICPVCTNGILVLEDGAIYPPPMAGREVKGLPPEIAEAWAEARRAFGAGAYTATELVCRKILMHVAVDVIGMKAGEAFLKYVEELEKAGHIAAGLKPAVDKIRQRGNFATHEIPSSSREDAERTMRITYHFLVGTYEIATL